ncbi:MAG: hypothetical protein AB8G26_17310 [Ilumatobacter sp.]
MRVTTGSTMRHTVDQLAISLERLQDSQRRLSTGKAQERMSDDPRAASDVLFLRGRIQRHEQLDRTNADTRSRLAVADTTLVTASNALNRATELAVRGGNSGSLDTDSRLAIANEVASLRTELLGSANTSYLGRPLFSGTAGGAAYDDSATYNGNGTVEVRTVGDGVKVAANVTGEQVFGDQAAPEGDVFAVLERMSLAIATGDITSLDAERVNLDEARVRLGTAMAEVGRRVSQLETVSADASVRKLRLVEQLSLIEDVDIAEALIQVNAQDNSYQAALSAAAKAMPPSLAQYLR